MTVDITKDSKAQDPDNLLTPHSDRSIGNANFNLAQAKSALDQSQTEILRQASRNSQASGGQLS